MKCQIAVRVTPRSAKPGIGGWRASSDGRDELEIRVAEAPTDGSANAAVVKLLAKALGVSKSEVEIVSGQGSMMHGTQTNAQKPGMVVHVPKGEVHAIKAQGGELTLLDFAQPPFNPDQMQWVK